MKLLGQILKVILCLLLLVVLLGALTALAWWMRWPIFTGVFISAGLLGAALLFFVGRGLWRLRNKRQFVRLALAGLETASTQVTDAPEMALETLWNTLMLRDRNKRQRPNVSDFLGRDWYVALDATPALSPVFTHAQSAWNPQQAFARHDFASTTLLQFPCALLHDDVGNNKEDLLTWMSRDVKKNALRGLVLLVSARELGNASESTLHELGFLYRAPLYELMVAMNRNVPLYVLVQDIEQLPGGALLLNRPGMSDNWLGRFFADMNHGTRSQKESFHPGQEAARTVEAVVRNAFYNDLVANRPAEQDELRCLEHFNTLGKKLDSVFSSLLQAVPRHDPLRLSGIFFCRTEHDHNPAAASATAPGAPGALATFSHVTLSRFFARVLPAEGAASQALRGRFAAYSASWLVGMSAWALLLLGVCGLLAAESIYQKRAITTEPVITDSRHHSKTLESLHRQMRYIGHLEAAKKHWILPSFGIDLLERVTHEEKNKFIPRLYAGLFSPLVNHLRRILNATSTEGYTERQHAALTQLGWLSNATRERLTKGKTNTPSIFFPLTAEDDWNTVDSELILAGLNWTENREQLEMLSGDIGNTIAYFISEHFDVFSNSVVEYYNTTNIDQRVCLSGYWPHIEENGENDFCIPAYYTAAGYEVNSSFFNGFVSAQNASVAGAQDQINRLARFSGDRNTVVNMKIRRISDNYLRHYAEIWRVFIQRFCDMAASLESNDAYEALRDLKNLSKTPHLRLIHQLNRELSPLQNANPRPAWMNDAHLLEVMLEVALEGHANPDPASWHTLLMAGTNMPDVLRTLWEKADNRQHMREIYDGIMGMTMYFSWVREILTDLNNPALSLILAKTHFGAKNAEALKQSSYTMAETRLNTALTLFSKSEAPQVRLLSNLLTFAGNGVTVEAALALQSDWENKVLSSPINRYRSYDREKMYGEKGMVTAFVEAEIAPFLNHGAQGTTVALWEGRPFPFTEDFLAFLRDSEEWAMTAPVNPGGVRSILLRSRPPVVNADAAARPDSVTLTLWCQDKTWQLINRNYPHNERFEYDPEKCGKVDLTIAFPAFELKRNYHDFLRLLEDFQYGEREFTLRDFPDSMSLMAMTGITSLKVRILPDGIADLLKEKNANIPVVPELITYVRN
ncbi:MAG: hypothetical protein LBU43_11955 [Candidatus Accumulibacter sp.]|jgi:hypothetical protein|nr:hypothetical protein [Accumulibacter sp.]